jgi:hypothetical protein
MHLVEDNHPMEGGGLCFLCEGYIDRDHYKVVDTGKLYDPPFHSPLVGRKYVCQGCGETIGKLLGMVPNDEVVAASAALKTAQTQMNDMKRAINAFGKEFSGNLDAFTRLPVIEVAVTDKPVTEAQAREKETVSG